MRPGQNTLNKPIDRLNILCYYNYLNHKYIILEIINKMTNKFAATGQPMQPVTGPATYATCNRPCCLGSC